MTFMRTSISSTRYAASRSDPLHRNDPFMPLSLPLLAGTAPDHDYTFVDLLWDNEVDTTGDYDLVGISVRMTLLKLPHESSTSPLS